MTLLDFRFDLHIASKCGCLSEPEGELAQEHLRIKHIQ